ncbi:hypothetical protein TorRG33x02_142820 [Trema orientale]|uniref:Uncharacterized protein n=1 Tax=Trema orientale TaxID=63057 RepID=A0A2P5EWS4_TREOI|nr:hypothetical protein TorRG33x02_142820 [Trema orientale]
MAEFAAAKYSYLIVREGYVGPRCCRKMTLSGVHRRNRAHDPTSDGCQLPPKKRGVGSVWDTYDSPLVLLLSHCIVPLLILSPKIYNPAIPEFYSSSMLFLGSRK